MLLLLPEKLLAFPSYMFFFFTPLSPVLIFIHKHTRKPGNCLQQLEKVTGIHFCNLVFPCLSYFFRFAIQPQQTQQHITITSLKRRHLDGAPMTQNQKMLNRYQWSHHPVPTTDRNTSGFQFWYPKLKVPNLFETSINCQ